MPSFGSCVFSDSCTNMRGETRASHTYDGFLFFRWDVHLTVFFEVSSRTIQNRSLLLRSSREYAILSFVLPFKKLFQKHKRVRDVRDLCLQR